MKKYNFPSGVVVVEEKNHEHSKKAFWQVNFIGHGLFGWGISKNISQDEFNGFGAERAQLFMAKTQKMLSV
jgi:hypothetical protein